jgi:hypothetical protein
MTPQEEMQAFAFRTMHRRLNRCIAPGISCEETAIRAHSIQNARVLDLLCSDGHVVAPVNSILNKRPKISFEKVGRNKASTFTGLCAAHDAEIFRTIDTEVFDVGNSEHLFLIAYRAVLREAHAKLSIGTQFQSAYRERIRLGLDAADVPTRGGLIALEHMMSAFETHEYKTFFDAAFLKKSFGLVSHSVLRMVVEHPTVAVCALYSADDVRVDDDVLRIAFNVIPTSKNETIVTFSYLKAHSGMALAHLDQILASSSFHQRFEISKLILRNCENFAISPEYYSAWSPKKLSAIMDYFIKTLLVNDGADESEHLYLF